MTTPLHSILAGAQFRPRQQEGAPPCCGDCATGADVRGWIGIIAQRRKLALDDAEAFRRAWNTVVEANPFPATLGRVCPHPCESNCNRAPVDGAVAVNALERFIGDWALEHRLALPTIAAPGSAMESIGVVGAGPAGLSFAYQMARRGYRVTVYEKSERAGGMLQHGIPEYRLPESVLAAEVARIVDMGVELRLATAVGRDVTVADLRARHDVLFLGIGAGRGLRLGIPGEDGPGALTGTEYLARLNRGEAVALGERVIVVGGGNTAIDAARAARRSGTSVTILYRRTRAEMPAIAAEVDDALLEGVTIEFLAAPVEIKRANGRVRSVVVRCMELGEVDASGRRASKAVEGSETEIAATTVIAAVSQQPDWDGLADLQPAGTWQPATPGTEIGDRLYSGGDTTGLGLAGAAIRHGRQAAEALHARLRGESVPATPVRSVVKAPALKPEFHAPLAAMKPPRRPADDWRAHPDAEVVGTITEAEFLAQAERCLSCGQCFGCEHCFTFCTAGAFTRLETVAPGAYFSLNVDVCQGCGECIDLCPCGFLTRA